LHDRRVPGLRVQELAQLGVDHDELRVGVDDQPAGLGDEVLDRPETHGEGEDDHRGSRQPRGLHGGDEGAGRGAQQRDVAPGPDAAGLEGGGHAAGVVVETGPLDALPAAGSRRSHERDGVACLSGRLEARQKR
jgi:hypothetical protein